MILGTLRQQLLYPTWAQSGGNATNALEVGRGGGAEGGVLAD